METVEIIPIPKSNIEFRPIAILPLRSKIMAKQMNDYLMRNKILSDKQSGFMKARSYSTALVNVVEDLRLKLDDNNIAF